MTRRHSGYFITLEGPEGSGKTSHVPRLIEYFQSRGLEIFATREPGGTIIGEIVRGLLHDKKNTEMLPTTETLLYQAARAQIVGTVIRPLLEKGRVILCDRFSDSTISYQGYGHNQNMDVVRELVKYATGSLKPDLTLLLDLDIEIGLDRKRAQNELNRLDLLPSEFHERVRKGYLKMVQNEPERWVVIDASRDRERVFSDLRREIENRLVMNGFIESDRRNVER